MNPTSAQLGANVQPILREYVQAAIAEALAEQEAKLRDLQDKTRAMLRDATILRDEANARIAKLESKLANDPAFSITKTKVARLMRELNLE